VCRWGVSEMAELTFMDDKCGHCGDVVRLTEGVEYPISEYSSHHL
jgi:hypothetical protein